MTININKLRQTERCDQGNAPKELRPGLNSEIAFDTIYSNLIIITTQTVEIVKTLQR